MSTSKPTNTGGLNYTAEKGSNIVRAWDSRLGKLNRGLRVKKLKVLLESVERGSRKTNLWKQ